MVIRRRAPAATQLRAVGYIRVSTSKQDLSPGAQGAALDRWAASEGVELACVFFDRGVSGGADVADRPALAAALAYLADRPDVGALVVAKRDRLARDVGVAASVERLAARAGARVLSADGSNGDDDGDALKRDLDAVLAAHERRVIRRRTRDALAVKKARGERTGTVPYGMRLAVDGVHLEPEASEQAVIARARELSDAGLTVRAIAATLTEEGYRNRAGKPFAFQSVYVFLRPLLLAVA